MLVDDAGGEAVSQDVLSIQYLIPLTDSASWVSECRVHDDDDIILTNDEQRTILCDIQIHSKASIICIRDLCVYQIWVDTTRHLNRMRKKSESDETSVKCGIERDNGKLFTHLTRKTTVVSAVQ